MIASNEHLCLIKSRILDDSDKLCRINTMFEDLFLELAQRLGTVHSLRYFTFFVSKSQKKVVTSQPVRKLHYCHTGKVHKY